DTLTLNGSNGTVAGTIAFFLCGPTGSVTSCVSGGTSIPVSGTNTISFTPPPAQTFSSSSTSRSATGFYCFQAKFTSRNSKYSSFTALDTTNECVQVVAATADYLGKVKGEGTAKNIKLKWRTVNEVGVSGFNVLRSSALNGTYAQVNANLLPALLT